MPDIRKDSHVATIFGSVSLLKVWGFTRSVIMLWKDHILFFCSCCCCFYSNQTFYSMYKYLIGSVRIINLFIYSFFFVCDIAVFKVTSKISNSTWETLKFSHKCQTLPKQRFLFQQAEWFTCKSLTFSRCFLELCILNSSCQTQECVKRDIKAIFSNAKPNLKSIQVLTST